MTDIEKEIAIKVGARTYNVSNSPHQLFVCGNDARRREEVIEAMVQATSMPNVEAILLSAEAAQYEKEIGAKRLTAASLWKLLDCMEKRYDAIEESGSRNYIGYNRQSETPLKLMLVIIDGSDMLKTKKARLEMEKALCRLAMKCRHSGIHIMAFLNQCVVKKRSPYEQFSPPIHVTRGFYMKDATNLIMNTLSRKGYEPRLSLAQDHFGDSIRVSIAVEIDAHPFFFVYNYDDRSANYALLFPCEGRLNEEETEKARAIFEDTPSECFDDVSNSYYPENFQADALALIGKKSACEVDNEFIDTLIHEVKNLPIVKYLNAVTAS